MNFRHIIFILVYFILCLSVSSNASVENVISDLETNESQIELPPVDSSSNSNNILTADNPVNAPTTENTHHEDVVVVVPINQETTEQTEQKIVNAPAVIDEPERQEQPASLEQVNDKDINKSVTIQENLTIPVFSEWTQQQMQEAEKKLVELTGNSTDTNKETKNDTLAKNQIVKMMRQKNYASPDCGAKILANNPEAQSSSSVLSDKDEYMLSPCTDRIWFVIELCDSIQAKRVELANFELFSSPLKAVSISVSNRFPTRDWTIAGHYDAKSERDVQVFELKDVTLFGKFVRVDLEYTNTEHYCPLSFFRVFGTSEIEAFEVENEPDERIRHIDVDDDYVNQNAKTETSKDNILNRAGQAVLSIVQKAAEVLVKSNGNGAKEHVISSKQFEDNCMSLSHDIVCEICSTDERTSLNNIISCKNSALKHLLENDVRDYLLNTITCNSILGFNLKSDSSETTNSFIASILPDKYIAAMCNLVASDQNSLPLKIEDMTDITAKLISKKDEVSLKNISGDVQCKQTNGNPSSNNSNNIETVQTDLNNVVNSTVDVAEPKDEKEVAIEQDTNSTGTVDDQNIFNNIDRTQPFLEDTEEVVTVTSTEEIPSATEVPPAVQIEIKEPQHTDKVEIPKTQDSQQQVKNGDSKHTKPTTEPEQTAEAKASSKDESRSSNAPESVFLRLSNRIKVLEKNMTLSTQYLEELSRRYKKQIEDLQQAYSKLQVLYDGIAASKKESDRKDADDKKKLKKNVEEISNKSDFMEIILIVLTSLLILQIVFIVVLFKRLSILRDAFVANESSSSAVPTPVITQQTNGTKKKSKRVRKISAPNILSQRNGNSHTLHVTESNLNRTASAPIKVNEILEMKENLPQEATMLEENDEFLLSTFADLKLNDISRHDDNSNDNDSDGPKKIDDYELYDTQSTASVRTEEDHSIQHHQNGTSGSLVRRLSSPTFLKLKKTTALKLKNGRQASTMNGSMKKAKSESPPNFKSSSHNTSIQKSNSFEEDALKIRKNNSFKKLFKKLF